MNLSLLNERHFAIISHLKLKAVASIVREALRRFFITTCSLFLNVMYFLGLWLKCTVDRYNSFT